MVRSGSGDGRFKVRLFWGITHQVVVVHDSLCRQLVHSFSRDVVRGICFTHRIFIYQCVLHFFYLLERLNSRYVLVHFRKKAVSGFSNRTYTL